jgi:glycosyltransferase involved in cell wall biosynthesis
MPDLSSAAGNATTQLPMTAPTPSQSNKDSRCLFTIFIPTYNRAHTLPRALASIEQQTFRDFEVLIIDDGSTDDTRELIEQWRQRVDFPVIYHWQENQGKNGAHNAALPLAHGFFTVNLDSDDMLVPNALERLYFHWQQIPEAERDQYAGVEGLCVHMDSGDIAGTPFPQDSMDSDYYEIREKYQVKGDKKCAVRTDIMREYPYPRFSGERHVRPSLLWKRIARKYKFRYVNEIIERIEYQPGGLSSNRFALRMKNPNGFRCYFLEEINYPWPGKSLKRSFDDYAKYVRYSLHSGIGYLRQFKDARFHWLWLLAAPVGSLQWLGDKVRLRQTPINKTS